MSLKSKFSKMSGIFYFFPFSYYEYYFFKKQKQLPNRIDIFFHCNFMFIFTISVLFGRPTGLLNNKQFRKGESCFWNEQGSWYVTFRDLCVGQVFSAISDGASSKIANKLRRKLLSLGAYVTPLDRKPKARPGLACPGLVWPGPG